MKTLLPILFLLAAVAATARSETTYFTFDFYGNNPDNETLQLQGNAHFPSDTTYLRLTEDRPWQVGRAVVAEPIQFWQTGGQIDFVTSFKFIIRPNSAGNPADGIAFFIAPVGTTIPAGSEGGRLGIFGANGKAPNVFAVVFDTFVNGGRDPNLMQIGIDIGSRASVNITAVDNSTIVGRRVYAEISYDSSTKRIFVDGTANLKKFAVTYNYDLSNLLTQQVQFGLSASTGQHVAKHDINAWYFRSTMQYTNNNASESKKFLGNVIQQVV